MSTHGALRPPSLPVPVLRDAVAREVATLSLRRAAREIGLSPNGLRNFLAAGPRVGALVRLLGELGAELPARDRAALGQDLTGFLLRAYLAERILSACAVCTVSRPIAFSWWTTSRRSAAPFGDSWNAGATR